MNDISLDVVELCYFLFEECMKEWGLSFSKLSDLIKDFKLVSFVNKYEDYLNDLAIYACVDEIKKYIIEKGGNLK